MLTYQDDYLILRPGQGVNYWDYYPDIEDAVIGNSAVVITTKSTIWIKDSYLKNPKLDKVIVGFKNVDSRGEFYKFKYILIKDLKKIIDYNKGRQFDNNPETKYPVNAPDLQRYVKPCENILKEDLPQEIQVNEVTQTNNFQKELQLTASKNSTMDSPVAATSVGCEDW